MQSDAKQASPNCVVAAYGLLLLCAFALHHFIANGEFSVVLTLAATLQTFAFALLGLQTFTAGHAGGISARALVLDAMALGCRLSSTIWLNGYLPVDASGDWIYQAVDLCSLALVSFLLYQVLVKHKESYQAQEDSFPVIPFAAAAIFCAAMLHADMNSRPIFDTLWMAGLFISAVAVLPQLWLVARTGGRVEALTSHYIAIMAVGRAMSGTFMWHARHDITCQPLWGINHAIWAILGAHILHLVLLGDFAYYYARALTRNGLLKPLDLAEDLGCYV